MSVVLASGSPRRKELLEMLGVKGLKVIPAKGEEIAPEGAAPDELVMTLASAKGREVAALCDSGDVIIAADTIVWFDGKVFGKPHCREDAVKMLSALSGQAHEVYTGVSVIKNGQELRRCDRSRVFFREITASETERYVDTGEPMDKAGAYGAQGKGAMFVRRIEGDFFNVMGLPVCMLCEMLKELGVEIL